MGVVDDSTAEHTALLAVPPRQQVASKQAPFAVQPPTVARNWDGQLCECCGSQCSGQGWASCAFTFFLPCFAFGSNMKRVFLSSLWLQALLFFVLFYGAHWSLNLAVSVTSDQCQADLPASVKPPHVKPAPVFSDAGAEAHESWLSGRKLLQIDDGPGKFTEAFADVLPSAAVANAVVHGGAEDQFQSFADSAHVETMDIERIEGRNIEFDGDLETKVQAEDAPEAPMPMSVTCLKWGPFKACSEPHPAPPPHPVVMPFTPNFQHASPGCQKAFMGLAALYHLAILFTVIGVIYAARQRTFMRQKFLIPGSKCCDLWTWLCCPLCALCQETRTLHSNNVRNGEWGGFLEPGLVVTAADWAEPALVKPPKLADMPEV